MPRRFQPSQTVRTISTTSTVSAVSTVNGFNHLSSVSCLPANPTTGHDCSRSIRFMNACTHVSMGPGMQ